MKKKSNSRSKHNTRPLNSYATRQLEIYGGGTPPSILQSAFKSLHHFFRTKIKQPIIAIIGLSLGIGFIYWILNLQSDGPIRQQTMALVKQYALDSPIKQLEKIGRMVQEDAEYTVLMDGMERTRIMLEAYPIEGGSYPENLDALYERAQQEGYWALTKNPFTKSRNQEGIIRDFSDYITSPDQANFSGMILYEPMGKYNYRIYGCDEKGSLIKKDHQIFSLSRP